MALTRFGLHLSSFSYPQWDSAGLFATIRSVAQAAEHSGFDAIFVPDHAHQNDIGGGPASPMFEAYTLLGALAAVTSSVRLGAVVSPVTFREPALFAKTVTSLDVISSGRAILGLGAAWDTAEHTAYGVEFPGTAERFERLEEALQICAAMSGVGPASFAGAHYRLEGAYNSPPAVNGRIPVLVGGGGERKTLRLVAQYADACNVFGDPATLAHKLSVLDEHCAALGRDRGAITTTAGIFAPSSVDELVEKTEACLGAGIDGVVVFGGNCPDATTVEAWGAALTSHFG